MPAAKKARLFFRLIARVKRPARSPSTALAPTLGKCPTQEYQASEWLAAKRKWLMAAWMYRWGSGSTNGLRARGYASSRTSSS